MDVLRVDKLEKSFGRRKVVDGVSLQVARGEIVGLLGPNGAGKSTSFKMICGLLQPDSGSVFLGEHDVTNWPMFLRARNGGMGYLAQEPSFFKRLTVEQNVSSIMEMLGYSRSECRKRTEEVLKQIGIYDLRTQNASSLSGGQRRRLEVARSLVSNPKIIMLDEPLAGVDPSNKNAIIEIMKELKSQHISTLITDHSYHEILNCVDRCYYIDEGTVKCDGDPATLRKNPDFQKKYLGQDALDNPANNAMTNRTNTSTMFGTGLLNQRFDSPSQQKVNTPAAKKPPVDGSSTPRRAR